MYSYSARSDHNQPGLVDVARRMGADVLLLHRVGGGCPDLLIHYHGHLALVEIKTQRGKLNRLQEEFRARWPVHVIRTVDDMVTLVQSMQ